jgi:hypothetical protein
LECGETTSRRFGVNLCGIYDVLQFVKQKRRRFAGRQIAPTNMRRLLPLAICLATFVTLWYLSRLHPIGTYGTETDFYHLFAPDAARLANRQFPENPFQGPGYPLVLALGAKITGDLFIAGKWISILAATGVAFCSFLLFDRLFGYWVGIGAALLVVVSGEFPMFAISATTDVFFLLLCLACLASLTIEFISPAWRMWISGALAGFAYLTRYNGMFLIVAVLIGVLGINVFATDWPSRAKLALIFVVIALIVTAPWLYANYRQHRSPFYNANYLNIATEFYPELSDGMTNQEGTRKLEPVFHSFGEVARYDPGRFALHYPVNLWSSFLMSLDSTLVSRLISIPALVGLAVVLINRKSKMALMVVIAAVLYFLLMGLTHWEARYYFFLMVIYCGFGVFAVIRGSEMLGVRGWLTILPGVLIAAMWGVSLASSWKEVKVFLSSHPMEVVDACGYLRRQGVSGARIMSRKPHLPAICGEQWVYFPSVKSIDELKDEIVRHPVDYLTISSIEVRRRRELAVLIDPKNAPPWLKAVWVNENPKFVLYKIEGL